MTGLPIPPGAHSLTSGLGGASGYRKLNPYGNLSSSTTGGSGVSGVDPGGDYSPGNPGADATFKKTLTLGASSNDYASQIENDPAYQSLKNMLSAQGITDAAHLRGALQAALIQFGAVPNLPSDVLANSGLDTGATQALADQNPFSALKRLYQNYQDTQQATENQLAARGILNSGETGYQLGRLGQQEAQSQYDLTNNLLGNIGSLNDAYAAGRQAAAQQLAQGAITAEGNAAASGTTTTGPTLTWNGSDGYTDQTGAKYAYDPSTGTVVSPGGQRYDMNGNPITLPGAGSGGAPATGGGYSGAVTGGLTTGANPLLQRALMGTQTPVGF